MSLIEVRLRPTGPWRAGHRGGDRERVDVVYHSDSLYSAITQAMRMLGWLEEWLDATARAATEPVVRFSSLFPYAGKTRLVTPPKTAWPSANAEKLVPLEIAHGSAFDQSRWSSDGASDCLIPVGSIAPFHISLRTSAATDRITGAVEPHRIACLEFAPNAGWWGLFEVEDKEWEGRVKAAFRLLADSGFGGERSRGWGRASQPQFADALYLFPKRPENGLLWLLSLYSPHEADVVDWSRGEYAATVRGGWTESPSGSVSKKQARMIEEGSVLSAESLRGRAVDVAPEGFAHPVYRAGFALAVGVPQAPEPKVRQAVPPVDEAEALEPIEAAIEPATELGEVPKPVAPDEEPEISEPIELPDVPSIPEPQPGEPAAPEPIPEQQPPANPDVER
jgi:CRISPR/Cas system CSM-associated protein Csm4 (group 5 of RAMP superfamily)